MVIAFEDKIMFSGRVAKEPDKKVVGKYNSQIVELSVISGGDGENTEWENVYAWGSTLAHIKKGDQIFGLGFREVDEYTSRTGERRVSEKIRAEFAIVVGSSQPKKAQKPAPQEIEEIDDEENLPF